MSEGNKSLANANFDGINYSLEETVGASGAAKPEGITYRVIIEKLLMMMTTGNLKQGEKLPSERMLAEKFHVSRVPVREALKVLEYLGFLQVGTNGTLYVAERNVETLVSKLNFGVVATPQSLHDLFEVRISLESTACYYAALRRTDEDIQKIRSCLDNTRRLIETSSDTPEEETELRKYSHQFHIFVVEAAHNSVLTGTYHSLFNLLEISQQQTIHSSSGSYDTLLAHEAIFNQIVAQDADRARADIIGHLNHAMEKLNTHLNGGN